MSDPRTVRQRLVPEIGAEGQARIDRAASVVLVAGLAGEIEARYLAGAGFGLVRTISNAVSRAALEQNPRVAVSGDADPMDPPDQVLADSLSKLVENESARAVAVGAARALRQIRVAAGIDVEPIFHPRTARAK
jgi:molybdopterin/thiamine biosynthesis adenylyltransferase